jgi:hypothetical protein
MLLFSHGLSAMLQEDDQWGPPPAAEATKSECETAEDAALSGILPIQDGNDQLGEHKSSTGTELGGPAPG